MSFKIYKKKLINSIFILSQKVLFIFTFYNKNLIFKRFQDGININTYLHMIHELKKFFWYYIIKPIPNESLNVLNHPPMIN